MAHAYVGIGSNLSGPDRQCAQAVTALEAHFGPCTVSALYRFPAFGPPQPDYCNACIGFESAMAPEALLSFLLAQEQQQGRVRTQHWGPRTLDLDLLWYGGMVRASGFLTLPHPGLEDRPTVLIPLRDIAAEWQLPSGPTVMERVAARGWTCSPVCTGRWWAV